VLWTGTLFDRLPKGLRLTAAGEQLGPCDVSLDDLVGAAEDRQWNGQPNALAVLRLMISSIFVDWTTGKSPGFAPARTRPV
jgi:DNA-binding transcriptional LysR family regulator